jgi:glutamate-1-semialdehyde 2,1-aminomutase
MQARERLGTLRDRELARFAELRPRGTALLERARAHMPNGAPMTWMGWIYGHPPLVATTGRGARFTDLDGIEYLDFNLADTSMFAGYGVEALTRVVAERVEAGPQFLLPTEDAIAAAAALAGRFGLPQWQFTLSATQANVEVLRIARAITGRPAVLMFDGKYHGHADELFAGGRGLPADSTRNVRFAPYNDLEAVERELARGDVAVVLAEAAITNTGVIMPADGFHAGLRRLASDAGALLALDETHTLVAGPGGLTRRWGLEPDLLVLGKAIASGIAVGAYGMTAAVAGALELEPGMEEADMVATGGTLFGNALSMAATRVTLEEILTDAAYEHAAALGARLADGIERVAAGRGLEWRAHRLYNRSGYTHAPELPVNAEQARERIDYELFGAQRLYLANRGVWEAIDSAGPACGTQAGEDDVDRYLEVLDAFLGEVVTSAAPRSRRAS